MTYTIWTYIIQILRDRAQYYSKRKMFDVSVAYETAIALITYGIADKWEMVKQFDYYKERD